MKNILSLFIIFAVLIGGMNIPAQAKKIKKAPIGIQQTDKKLKLNNKKSIKQKAKEEEKIIAKEEKRIKDEEKKLAKEEQKSIKKAQTKLLKEEKRQAKIDKKAQKNADKEAKKLAKADKKAKTKKSPKVSKSKNTETREVKVSSPNSENPNYNLDTPIGRELRLLDTTAYQRKHSALARRLNPNLDIREIRASHILVKKRKDAVMIKKDIESGQITFEEAARKYSMCPSSINGGDLGFFTREKMEPQFSERAFDTPIGSITGPVGTKFGWHLIKTTDKR